MGSIRGTSIAAPRPGSGASVAADQVAGPSLVAPAQDPAGEKGCSHRQKLEIAVFYLSRISASTRKKGRVVGNSSSASPEQGLARRFSPTASGNTLNGKASAGILHAHSRDSRRLMMATSMQGLVRQLRGWAA
jgi:hypothetical protein